jgi:hypothetical protein
MAMIENVSENIVNMIKCRRGEHCLFRSFGLGAKTDDVARLTRSIVQVEINRWFPGTNITEFKQSGQNAKGEFIYNISVRG